MKDIEMREVGSGELEVGSGKLEVNRKPKTDNPHPRTENRQKDEEIREVGSGKWEVNRKQTTHNPQPTTDNCLRFLHKLRAQYHGSFVHTAINFGRIVGEANVLYHCTSFDHV
jgi:hypothetical protein